MTTIYNTNEYIFYMGLWTGAFYGFEKFPPCVCMIGLIVNSRKNDIGRQAKPRILYFITKI